jgi:hypothetical protein
MKTAMRLGDSAKFEGRALRISRAQEEAKEQGEKRSRQLDRSGASRRVAKKDQALKDKARKDKAKRALPGKGSRRPTTNKASSSAERSSPSNTRKRKRSQNLDQKFKDYQKKVKKHKTK